MSDITGKQDDLKENYLAELKKNFTEEKVLSILSSLAEVKVAVIGDTIIDEYAYCDNLERAKKEPILVFQYKYSENYAGGILAIANHVSEFSNDVTLITHIGADALTQELISTKLNPKINKKFFSDPKYPTLVKKRYISSYTGSKAFEVYNKEPDGVKLPEDEICSYLENNLSSFDLVILADFGHGMITDRIKEIVCQKSKYLAVNVQTNSGNIGFNLITKMSRADYISLTAEELQLAMHDRKSDLKELVKKLSLHTKCKKISITLGKNGLMHFDNWNFFYAPIFSSKVVDTVGAGDAVFSVTSLMTQKMADPNLIPFVGNCMGALAVKIRGNKEPVRSAKLNSFIQEIFSGSN